ncbi:MAG TPA: response regulator, partial [Steroidobacteraceae bacterium]|nr:response regulator [Steroidobacteraceae bacterium]
MNGLLVDDDEMFLRALQKALLRRGVSATTASSIDGALASAAAQPFDFVLVDLRIGRESGLRLIQPLRAARPRMRILLMTGFASVATAVEAIKLGADDYLLKPVNVETIMRALTEDATAVPEDPDTMIPLSRLEWEHIQQALRATDGNVSAA